MSSNGTTRAPAPIANTAYAGFDLFDRKGMDSAFAIASSLIKGWSTMGEAWLSFSRSQVESNLALLQSLSKCQDPMSAWSLHLDGAHEAVSRCMTAATRTSDIASKIAAEALAPLNGAQGQRAA